MTLKDIVPEWSHRHSKSFKNPAFSTVKWKFSIKNDHFHIKPCASVIELLLIMLILVFKKIRKAFRDSGNNSMPFPGN
jgi:hypothetical protein